MRIHEVSHEVAAFRSVWIATPVWVRPVRCLALRKAPWTLERLIGDAAVGLWVCARPVAGKSPV
jgi:hypothetical protein